MSRVICLYPSFFSLYHGPHCYFHSIAYSGGKSLAVEHVKLSLNELINTNMPWGLWNCMFCFSHLTWYQNWSTNL